MEQEPITVRGTGWPLERMLRAWTRQPIRHSALRGARWLLVLTGSLLAACAAAPAPEEAAVHVAAADIELARQGRAEILSRFAPSENAAVQAYVQQVGRRLAATGPRTNVAFQFTVLDTPGMFAYSLADGQVFISRGMLLHLNTEAQLAAVLAHEIGHVVASHQARQRQELRRAQELEAKLARHFGAAQARDTLGTLGLARVRGYSREFEIEADVWSERLLARAGYDPGATAQVLRFLMQQDAFWETVGFELWEIPDSEGGRGVFATHPSVAARLERTLARVGETAPALPDPAYLKALRGMVYGLPERYGVQRGRRYVHPERRLGFDVPDGWYLFGAGESLVAAPRTQEALLIITMDSPAPGVPVRRALEELAHGRALQSVERLSNGKARGETATIKTEDETPVRLAVLDLGRQRIAVVGIPFTPDAQSEVDKRLRALLTSLHAVSKVQAQAAEPLRLHVASGAQGAPAPDVQPFSDHPRERWEILNQLYPRGTVPPGRWIKSVR